MNGWRHMKAIDGRYVWANIPSYTAEGWASGKREISMKTIVGSASRKTPVFSDEIEYAVANPKWYAPVSIVRRDKLPKLQEDPSYAARNGYSIYDRATGTQVSAETVNWSDPSSATDYQFVQASGAGNALGELKIIFPNKDAIYLHGTPGKYLFDRAERAFSSGCVRLEDPASMARWISGGDATDVAAELDQALKSGQLKRVPFNTKTPVHITYMTVTSGDDGKLSFWRDIYHREKATEQATDVARPYEPVEPAETEANQAIASVDKGRVQTVAYYDPQRAG
jgi:murein L,D-transpeptidase YcbB/YkuD